MPRTLFPATDNLAYFNTAAVGLASHALTSAFHRYVDEWSQSGLDYVGAKEQPRRRGHRLLR